MPSFKIRPKTLSRHGRQYVVDEQAGAPLGAAALPLARRASNHAAASCARCCLPVLMRAGHRTWRRRARAGRSPLLRWSSDRPLWRPSRRARVLLGGQQVAAEHDERTAQYGGAACAGQAADGWRASRREGLAAAGGNGVPQRRPTLAPRFRARSHRRAAGVALQLATCPCLLCELASSNAAATAGPPPPHHHHFHHFHHHHHHHHHHTHPPTHTQVCEGDGDKEVYAIEADLAGRTLQFKVGRPAGLKGWQARPLEPPSCASRPLEMPAAWRCRTRAFPGACVRPSLLSLPALPAGPMQGAQRPSACTHPIGAASRHIKPRRSCRLAPPAPVVQNAKGELVAIAAKSTKALILSATMGGGSEMIIDVAPGVDWTAVLACMMAVQQVGSTCAGRRGKAGLEALWVRRNAAVARRLSRRWRPGSGSERVAQVPAVPAGLQMLPRAAAGLRLQPAGLAAPRCFVHCGSVVRRPR